MSKSPTTSSPEKRSLEQRQELPVDKIVAGVLDRVERVAKLVGLSPRYLVRKATGNQHLFDRLPRKGADLAADVKEIDDYLTETEAEFHASQTKERANGQS